MKDLEVDHIFAHSVEPSCPYLVEVPKYLQKCHHTYGWILPVKSETSQKARLYGL